MTLPSTGAIAVSDVNTELGLSASYSSSLNFLKTYMKAPPTSPNMSAFYGLAYYQRNADGNCNNGNCPNCNNCPNGNCTSNCNCGNIQCTNCYIAGASDCAQCVNCSAINCANCDGQNYLQANCNCACTYNCNCNGAPSYNCVVGPVSYACNCACNCSKIICAKLYEFGLMDNNIWAADQAYGQWLRKNDRKLYRGYVRWARIVTAWMDGKGPDYMVWIKDPQERAERQKAAITDMAIKIGTPWSEHMAWLMGEMKNDNQMGRILMAIGTPICKLVDMLPRSKKRRTERKHSLITLYTMWALFYISYYTSLTIVKSLGVVDKIKKTKLFSIFKRV